MKIWTIQSKQVVDDIMGNNVYIPDFNKSSYLEKIPSLKDLYTFMLHSYNNVNGSHMPGVIFGFAKTDNRSLLEISDIDEFKELMIRKKEVIVSLWKQFSSQGSVILELEYQENFNPICIDLNDFQFLMPPIVLVPPYSEIDINRLLNNIANGVIQSSIFTSGIIQTHTPYIKKENIIRTHEFFEIE
ncbi:hypothetical protein R6U77_08170 [Lysinibacillus louembei]|uniref:Schlafen AlbA-2 domain-containing protein n=1 Tax=Lysinibacillus louembei TaxID=1470088 RepID=A0ABZ0S2T2_9BACI|nr:hypothetical protein [Lysinibacillus louembei]WPK13626.1 hypothetical protein R6U77_08170 [Lysinibacillus louembei]